MTVRTWLWPAVVCWLTAGVGCTTAALPSEIVLGVSLPLSGPEAEVGEAMRRGYSRAIDEVNASGGARLAGTGRRLGVRLEVRDDRGEAARVEHLTEELIAAGAHAQLGTAGAVRTAVQSAVAERLSSPLIVNLVDADGLPGSRAVWVRAVPAAGDLDERAYETAHATIRLVEAAGSVDPTALRYATVR
jgi:ABC-type branched-subunit amino acid transport system substrate-binding protein